MHARMVLAAEDEVGESIVWDAPSASLLWVDIPGRRIHRLRPSDGAHRVWRAPDFPTSIGLRTDGGAVVGLTNRVALWNYGNDFTTLALPEPDLPDNRLNEGRVAPDGSFWVGTMQNNLTADGRPKDMDRASGGLYRIDGDGGVTRLAPEAYGITNTMAWTDDGRFITADTVENRFYVYDMAADGMSLSGRKPFAEPLDRGLPDGSCLDAQDISGTAGWSAAAPSPASRPTDRSTALSICRVPGRPAVPLAARTWRRSMSLPRDSRWPPTIWPPTRRKAACSPWMSAPPDGPNRAFAGAPNARSSRRPWAAPCR